MPAICAVRKINLISNELKYYTRNAIVNVSQFFSTGIMMQGFLSSKGVSPVYVGYFSFAVSIVLVISAALLSIVVDKIRSLKRAITFLMIPMFAFFAIMTVLCMIPSMSSMTVFYIATVSAVLFNFLTASKDILDYKLPHVIIDINRYPQLISTDGLCIGITGFLTSAVLSFCTSVFNYTTVLRTGFLLCAILTVVATVINHSFIEKRPDASKDETDEVKPKVSVKTLLKDRDLTVFILPNLMRGMAMGVMNIISLIWLNDINHNASTTSYLVVSTTAGLILGNFIYKKASVHHVRSRQLCFFGSVLMIVFMPAMLLGRQMIVFGILYWIAYMGMVIAGNSIPCYVMEVVPFERLGTYTSIRLMLTNGGASIASLLTGYLVGKVPSLAILIVAGCLQLTAGTVYLLYRPRAEAALCRTTKNGT